MSTCVLLALISAPASAQAIDWDLLLSNRFYAESLPLDVLDAQLRVKNANTQTSDRAAYQVHALGFVRGRPVDALGLELGLDTGLLEFGTEGAFADGQPIGDRAKETLFLGETGIDLQLGATGVLEIRAGKIRPRIGAGAIFDTYAFGVTADWDQSLLDRDNPWRVRVHALLPDATFTAQSKQSPLFAVELGYAFEHDFELELFGAAFVDTENGLTPVLADAVFRGRLQASGAAVRAAFPAERPIIRNAVGMAVSEGYRQRVIGYDVESSGTLGWVGLTARKRDEGLELSGALIFGLGSIDMATSPNAGLRTAVERIKTDLPRIGELVEPVLGTPSKSNVSLFSYFADLEATYRLPPAYAFDAFAILMSGDRGLSEDPAAHEDRYTSFVGLAPLLPFTAIFFRGGIASSLASPAVASVAPDGAGLAGGGVGFELTPVDIVTGRISGAMLFATVSSQATGSSVYGLEADAAIDIQAAEFLALSAQGAIFSPGKYFGDLPVGYQVIASAHLLLP